MSERDTKFQNFAKLLVHDLNNVSTTTYASYDEAKKAYELTIARRAYDLVKHAFEDVDSVTIQFEEVPDMTELPKESS